MSTGIIGVVIDKWPGHSTLSILTVHVLYSYKKLPTQYNKLPIQQVTSKIYTAYERNLRVKKKMFSLYDMIGIVLRIIIY